MNKNIIFGMGLLYLSTHTALPMPKPELSERDKVIIAEIEKRLEKGVNLDELLTSVGTPPLFELSRMPLCHRLLRRVVEAGAWVNDCYHGNTPLHCACVYNNRKAVSLLVANGSDAQAKNNYGTMPLCNLLKVGKVTRNLIRMLRIIAPKMDLNQRIETTLASGNTYLHRALFCYQHDKKQNKVYAVLLDAGANPYLEREVPEYLAPDYSSDYDFAPINAIEYAQRIGNTEAAQFIEEYYKSLELNSRLVQQNLEDK